MTAPYRSTKGCITFATVVNVVFLSVSLVVGCSPRSSAPPQTHAGENTVQQVRVTATTLVSAATPAAAQADAPQEFQLPSGNLGCDYVPAGGTATYTTPDGGPELICDRIAPTYVRMDMSAHGAPHLITHVGDAGCCGGDTMAYGTHWTGGPFSCEMSEAGITCTNADRRGFTLSRSTARVN